jgi:allantoinase
MLDWVNDEMPYVISTRARPSINLPLNHELSDRQIITIQQQSADSYAPQIRDAFAWVEGEAGRYGGRMLPLHLTPYIMALPYRIGALEGLIRWLGQQGAWITTTGKVIASMNLLPQ